jgi:chromosome segregation protein
MRLEYIEVAGFRGFKERTRFELAPAFVVVTGRNGSGKSTILDAVEFALTGTLSKYVVQNAKGGGLADHIWWMGDESAPERRVEVGFVNNDGEKFVVSRGPHDHQPEDHNLLRQWFGIGEQLGDDALGMLTSTSIIRDEHIAAMSLDLPGQKRFEAVKEAIGAIVGPDFSIRTAAILSEASGVHADASQRQADLQEELGRALTALTDARSEAERSSDLAQANRILEMHGVESTPENNRVSIARTLLAERRSSVARVQQAINSGKDAVDEWRAVDESSFASALEQATSQADRLTALEEVANLALERAIEEDAAVRARDADDSHWAALIEHGSALGLIEGHCPLCDAARSDAEFAGAIERVRVRLADRGADLARLSAAVTQARSSANRAKELAESARANRALLEQRKERALTSKREVASVFERERFEISADEIEKAQGALQRLELNLIELENAIFVLEASSAHDRVIGLERRIAEIRAQIDAATVETVAAEKGAETARQIDTAARAVANEILKEQFDTVMPLLKELYRRLRPHVEWTEIDSDFGGKVRATLNFTVGEGRNPQFLFSSGQRRAAGLAFLLAIHLSRPWCRWQSLLLDDPVQHIDDYRALNLVEVLGAIRRLDRQTIVAVEDSALADLLCRRLRSNTSDPGCRFDLAVSGDGASHIESSLTIAPMQREVLQMAQAS